MLNDAHFFKFTGLHLCAIHTYDKLLQKISRGDLRAPHQLLAEILCQRADCFLLLVSKTFCDVVVFDILKRSRKLRRVHIFGNCFLYNVDHCLLYCCTKGELNLLLHVVYPNEITIYFLFFVFFVTEQKTEIKIVV